MSKKSHEQYKSVLDTCRKIFKNKTKDYGDSWRILRLPSITDQIYIKANRIRSIQEAGINKVNESIEDGFYAMINYSVIGIIQYDLSPNKIDLDIDSLAMYTNVLKDTAILFDKKNHDYGEAWRQMRISSMVDLILMKLLRIKQIEDNDGETIISEGVDASYQDIINYSIFCLILMSEKKLLKTVKKQSNDDK